MKKNKYLLKGGILSALVALSAPVNALEKPQTMEDMWKIIQAQQKQIDDMKSTLQAATPIKTVAGDAPKTDVQTPAVAKNTSNEVKTLERKTDVLTQEVEKLRTNLSIPEEAKYKSAYGMGPAASKVYGAGKGLSIGGYGEGSYKAIVGDKGSEKDKADLERAVLYVGYKFTDKILFNSEIEFEHASSGEGSELKGEVGVEFASLDFFIDPRANVRAGLVLMPMGLVNRIHEPLFYFGNQRPMVEQRIIPSTWREMGAGLFGAITPELTYTAYIVNGLDAQTHESNGGFTSDGIKEGRGGGSNANAETFGYVARMDYDPNMIPGLTVGGSGYVGKAGQNQTFVGQKADVLTQLYEAHAQWKYRGLEFRTLGSWGHIGDAALVSAQNSTSQNPIVVGSENYGWYSELGYDVLPILWQDTSQYLAPFFRYEHLNTVAKSPVSTLVNGLDPTKANDWQIYQVGLQYKPIPNVVIKADYRNFVAKAGSLADDFHLGFGFIF
jgi:hypothetical protein